MFLCVVFHGHAGHADVVFGNRQNYNDNDEGLKIEYSYWGSSKYNFGTLESTHGDKDRDDWEEQYRGSFQEGGGNCWWTASLVWRLRERGRSSASRFLLALTAHAAGGHD